MPSKIKNISITLRPKGGITDDDIALFLNIVLEKCKYQHVIAETKEEGSKHIHAALYFKNETTLSAWNQLMKRKFERSFEERGSIWKYAMKSKVMYNDDFLTNYLIKENEEGAKAEDECEVLESFLPSEEERCTYYDDVPVRKKSREHGDPYFLKLEKLYYEMIPEGRLAPSRDPTLQEIEHFLCVMMFKERKLRVITDSRKMRRVCKCLQKFICHATGYCWQRGDVESDIMQFPEYRS